MIIHSSPAWQLTGKLPFRNVVSQHLLFSHNLQVWSRRLNLVCYGLIAKSCPSLANPWTRALQASLSIGFSRQEYCSGLLFHSPGDLSDPGIEPRSPALQAVSLPT